VKKPSLCVKATCFLVTLASTAHARSNGFYARMKVALGSAFDDRRMSPLGLGCVITQRRSDGVERTFHQVSYLAVETSRTCSVAIDFGKLFPSSFDLSSSYTARVNNRPQDELE